LQRTTVIFQAYVVPHLRRPQTQYITPSALIRRYDVDDIFELLNSCDKEFTRNSLVEIRQQNAREEAEEPNPKERTMMVCS
jgi:hypothetical protein